MNLGIKTKCESCGATVLGVTDSLQKIGGKILVFVVCHQIEERQYGNVPRLRAGD